MFLIKYVLTTEKAVGAIEKENKLTFIVDDKASKPELKKEIETEYGEKTGKINVVSTPHGLKKAIVAFKRKGAASELAAKLKVI